MSKRKPQRQRQRRVLMPSEVRKDRQKILARFRSEADSKRIPFRTRDGGDHATLIRIGDEPEFALTKDGRHTRRNT